MAAFTNFSVKTDQPVEDIWKDAVEQKHQAATKMLAKIIPGRKYIDKHIDGHKVKQAIRDKKMAYKTWWNSRLDTDLQKYRNLKSAVKTAVAAAKEQYYQTLYDQHDTPFGENIICWLAKSHRCSAQDIGHVMLINEANALLRDKQSILHNWADYFHNISKKEIMHPPITSPDPTLGPVPSITSKEVMLGISKMKNGKATGPDDLPGEIRKILRKPASEFLASFFNQIFSKKQLPQTWTTSATVPTWVEKEM
ncbi:uncharacterized protein LOC126183276 [Schistocerca cancellata]|uniref:uncharacterized protein LOC126183276 n=1 Tax=Schistocerca cancellata TaxID=274614 RepID=UPI002118C101|nr:uncharacterized protein LOC126183276 [Schistocerca cancellata]